MKFVLSAVLVAATLWLAPLHAVISHELYMDGCDIKITVDSPEDFLEEKVEDLDLVFRDPEEMGRRVIFHYFKDPNFELSSVNGVFDYTDWIYSKLFKSKDQRSSSFSSGKDYAIRSFTVKNEEDKDVYCFTYVGKIEKELVFSSVVTSLKSMDDASKDCENFLKSVFWKR